MIDITLDVIVGPCPIEYFPGKNEISTPRYTSKKVPKKYHYQGNCYCAPFKKDASSERLTRVLVLVHGGGTLRALSKSWQDFMHSCCSNYAAKHLFSLSLCKPS
eukprot:SAG11_NODE_205_length_12427_cov_8.010140_9_plen_104_part_00